MRDPLAHSHAARVPSRALCPSTVRAFSLPLPLPPPAPRTPLASLSRRSEPSARFSKRPEGGQTLDTKHRAENIRLSVYASFALVERSIFEIASFERKRVRRRGRKSGSLGRLSCSGGSGRGGARGEFRMRPLLRGIRPPTRTLSVTFGLCKPRRLKRPSPRTNRFA